MRSNGGIFRLTTDTWRARRSYFAGRHVKLCALAIMFVVPAFSSSFAATPTDVSRAVSDTIAEVRLLHGANLSVAGADVQSINPANRRPRHALQLARTVLRKANQLALINGGSTVPEPPMSNREITPEDVLAVVQATTRVVRNLKPVFGVQVAIDSAASTQAKTPNDVYAALYRLSQMIDGLGIPVTVPNDVHQIAATIKLELERIAARYDVALPRLPSASATKTPTDVYTRAFELFDAFNRLTVARPELVPPGGLITPHRQGGKIRPAHVAYALNDLLAEVGAMKVAMGDSTPVRPAALEGGMTPTQVYDRLSEAMAIVEVVMKHV